MSTKTTRCMSRLALLTALLAPGLAGATVARALDLEGLAVRADEVIRGTVVDQRSRWDEDGRLIVTEVEVLVDGCLKGACEAELVTVRTLGGTIGDLTMQVHGVARYDLGEEVLLYLERPDPERALRRTVGMAQGKFRLVWEDGQALAVRDTAGLRFIGPGGFTAVSLDHLPLVTLTEGLR